MSTSGEVTSRGAPVLPDSVKMFMTPLGSAFALAMISDTSALVRAVWAGNFATTVLPAARAGASDRINSATGEFHGTITATTPAGSGRVLKNVPGRTSAEMPELVSAWPAA